MKKKQQVITVGDKKSKLKCICNFEMVGRTCGLPTYRRIRNKKCKVHLF